MLTRGLTRKGEAWAIYALWLRSPTHKFSTADVTHVIKSPGLTPEIFLLPVIKRIINPRRIGVPVFRVVRHRRTMHNKFGYLFAKVVRRANTRYILSTQLKISHSKHVLTMFHSKS